MNYKRWSTPISRLLVVAVAVGADGCHKDVCADLGNCQPPARSIMNCDPSTMKMDEGVRNDCGVFVANTEDFFGAQSDDDTQNDGTPMSPFKTLKAAVAQATARAPGLRNIYACGSFTETVELSAEVTFYGGYNCKNEHWDYHPSPSLYTTTLKTDANTIPLKVSGTSDVHVEVHDFEIAAANATTPGGSSIAVMIEGAKVTFTRCKLSAGDAMAGQNGDTGGEQAKQAAPGDNGASAIDGSNGGKGGKGGENEFCNLSNGNLIGGKGGDGGEIPSMSGNAGSDGDSGAGGLGGGEDSSSPGGAGMDVLVAGDDGAGASGSGSIDVTGYLGVKGAPGMPGSHGTSGGGGGGSKSSQTKHGAGGGGGGAGGCGGRLGQGGEPGGSSIAVLSLNASVTMMACTLLSGVGGGGGAGGKGQQGQVGGDGGVGGTGIAGVVGDAAYGGKGGNGSEGGNGGGGLGGHSLTFAVTGIEMPSLTSTSCKTGAHGIGGDGGAIPPQAMNAGAQGEATVCWDFIAHTKCMVDGLELGCPPP